MTKPKAKKPDAATNGAAGNPNDGGWAPVDPSFLVGTRSAAPAFPSAALPDRLRDTISAIATARCVNADLVSASVLAITAGAIGNRVRMAITERRTEPGTLFVCLVVEPGEGKSEAIDIASEGFRAMQRSPGAVPNSNSGVDHIVVQLERERNLRARLTLAADGVTPVPGLSHCVSTRRQLLLAETTVAGIRNALAAAPDGRAIVTDELLAIMNVAGGGDMMKARGLMLQAWDGKPYTFVNARDGEVTIPALQVTILGATQPDRVRHVLGPAHDGMASRFLWSAPDVTRTDALADSDGALDQLIIALGRLAYIEPLGKPGAYPRLVTVSPEARAVLRVANAGWNTRMVLAPAVLKSLLARARAQALRLSFNMALGERALAGAELPGGEITGEDAARGVTLMDSYFLPMGERVITEFGRRDIDPPAVQLARFLARLDKPVVNARDDIRRGLGSPVRDAEEIAHCLEELRLRGIVRPQMRGPAHSGRPAKMWEVNPHLSKLLASAR